MERPPRADKVDARQVDASLPIKRGAAAKLGFPYRLVLLARAGDMVE
jgi:hypothetical protein